MTNMSTRTPCKNSP